MIGLALAIVGSSAERSIEEQVSNTVRGDLVISRSQFQPFSAKVGGEAAKAPASRPCTG